MASPRRTVIPPAIARPISQVTDLFLALGRQYSGYSRLMRLDHPIGIWLLLWPTLWALWLAGDGHPRGEVFLVFVLGVVIMRSAGCVINDYADRHLDGAVARTKDRPLVSGEVLPQEALVLFAGLMLVALGLVLMLNKLSVQLALVGALVTIVYPFCKRFISTPQFVLGIAFGWGVPMAFAAQVEHVPRLGWLVFLAAILWAIIYDTEYAMADRNDDRKAGIRSTAILFGDADRFIVGLLQLMFVLTLMLIGQTADLGLWYLASVAGAAAFFLFQQLLMRERDPAQCFRAFKNNRYLGATVFVGIWLDYTLTL
jgi:4-hydroxybenzoate polyprenyltransferase